MPGRKPSCNTIHSYTMSQEFPVNSPLVSMELPEERGFTRRRVIAGLLAGAGGAGVYAYYGIQPALAITSNFASDISISTGDGRITDVSLGSNLSLSLSWDGLDEAPDNADETINVKSDDTGERVTQSWFACRPSLSQTTA